MASSEVKILGSWQSSFTLRARIALSIKSIAYELQQEEVLVAKSDLLLKSNPVYKKIPVIIHNDRPICESLIIVQYIDEVWASSGPAVLPSDPYDCAIARFWTTYIDQTWLQHLLGSLLSEGDEVEKTQRETIKGLVLLEEAFTKCSKGQKFFGGEKIGYLDIALGCFLPWIHVINKMHNVSLIDKSKTPNLFKWAQDFSTDAAVKYILPDTDKLYDFSNFLVSVLGGGRTK